MAKDGVPTVSEITLRTGDEQYRVIRHPDGTVEVEASDGEDHQFAMDALDRIGPLSKEPYYQDFMQAAEAAEAQRSLSTSAPASKNPDIAIGKAASQWLTEIKSSTKVKTHKIKTAAVESFAKHYGEKKTLKDAGRIDVGAWVPKVKVDGVNGAGNWLSKAFSRQVERRVGKPEKGKFGSHSLRKSVVQGSRLWVCLLRCVQRTLCMNSTMNIMLHTAGLPR